MKNCINQDVSLNNPPTQHTPNCLFFLHSFSYRDQHYEFSSCPSQKYSWDLSSLLHCPAPPHFNPSPIPPDGPANLSNLLLPISILPTVIQAIIIFMHPKLFLVFIPSFLGSGLLSSTEQTVCEVSLFTMPPAKSKLSSKYL